VVYPLVDALRNLAAFYPGMMEMMDLLITYQFEGGLYEVKLSELIEEVGLSGVGMHIIRFIEKQAKVVQIEALRKEETSRDGFF
jgi:hypothetical protein